MYDLASIVSNLFKDLNLSPCDLAYTLKRIKHEGFPFLSRVLPLYAKHILASIENGRWLDGFTHIRTKGRFPILFGSLLIEIFNCDGSVRVDANANSLRIIRQVCEYFYKLAVSGLFSSQVETEKFVKTDMELSLDYDYAFVDQLRKDFATYFRAIHDATIDDVVKDSPPRFGPGTYSGITPGEKWWLRKFSSEGPSHHFKNWWASLSPKVFNERYVSSTPCSDVEYNELLFVPKDSRGPRTIVREPASLLRFQMSYNTFMSHNLERYTHNRVNFVSQDINKRLAAESSLTREWSTIDLSSASDRVSYKLMRHIFRYSPLLKFITASTRWCLLPDGTYYKLNKLAGMGSGLTFPSMSLLIYLTLVRTICNTGLTYRRAMKLVYVYGDDIIVPTRYFDRCITALSRVQLVPNRDKSFCKSFFRESCGGDFYHGVSVAPIRLKLANANPSVSMLNGSLSLTCDRRSLPAFVLQLERHCRELVQHGFVNLARLYYSGIERVVGKLPYGSGDFPGLVRWYPSVSDYYKPDECGTYPMVSVKVVIPKREPAWEKLINVDYGTLLRQALAPDRSSLPWYNQCTDSSRVYDGVIPRTYKFCRRYYSAYSLMG